MSTPSAFVGGASVLFKTAPMMVEALVVG